MTSSGIFKCFRRLLEERKSKNEPFYDIIYYDETHWLWEQKEKSFGVYGSHHTLDITTHAGFDSLVDGRSQNSLVSVAYLVFWSEHTLEYTLSLSLCL